MKKILLSVLVIATLGFAQQSKAQCSGANITVFNVQFNGVNWQYQWIYNNGNASISVVYKCGGVVVGQEACYGDLKNQTPGLVTGVANFGTCAAPAAREIEIRVYSSSNCNGTFCPIAQSAPLPVSFTSFTATRSRANVGLNWSTASEQNNSGFAVERNTNGTWEQVAFVPSQGTGGNSTSQLSYSYSDVNNAKGISQYRVRQVDFDGKSKYTEIRSVRGDGQVGKTIVYPNPSSDGKVNLVFEEATNARDISVTDMTGRTVKQFKAVTSNNITIQGLTPGMYSVRIVVPATGEQSVEKIIVNKR